MFSRILIANRGEIACRVIDTAHRLGIETVAVHSAADAYARHVRMADIALPLGGRGDYLDIEAMVAAALSTGADAIHPGYGFLSENPEFVSAVVAAGLVFVGPPAAAIRAMGLKDAAKALMEQAGVPVVPGYHGADQDPEKLAVIAGEIGYPVLIKAVAGGGTTCSGWFAVALRACVARCGLGGGAARSAAFRRLVAAGLRVAERAALNRATARAASSAVLKEPRCSRVPARRTRA